MVLYTMSDFLTKHESLLTELEGNTEYNVYDSSTAMSLGEFPAAGVFLGYTKTTPEVNQYHVVEKGYILAVADVFDRDEPKSEKLVQHKTYQELVNILTNTGWGVVSDAEPLLTIASSEGFIAGWTIMLRFY